MKEDKFGIIEDDNYQFNSIEEAGNYTKDLKDKLKRKASMEEFPITSALPEDVIKYLSYAISLMTKKNLPFYNINKIKCAKSVLSLTARGYTFVAIANYLKKQGIPNVTIQKVKDVEKEGLEMATRAIERVQNTRVPIVNPGHQQVTEDFKSVVKDRQSLGGV